MLDAGALDAEVDEANLASFADAGRRALRKNRPWDRSPFVVYHRALRDRAVSPHGTGVGIRNRFSPGETVQSELHTVKQSSSGKILHAPL
jgi:hypothetical protein